MKDNFKIVRIIIEELLGIIESPDREIGSFASTEILEVLNGNLKLLIFNPDVKFFKANIYRLQRSWIQTPPEFNYGNLFLRHRM